MYFQEEKREEVKEWVLAVSMDQKVGCELVLGQNTQARMYSKNCMVQTLVLDWCGCCFFFCGGGGDSAWKERIKPLTY